ncbi:McrB family protein [Marinomonas flavescens]|uniref:McrB family protein n=1 Tax=Marinomonas flavescens TaxID=2529379 RepID=UPI001054B399|nr:AAA family ATPase [Marinomonas flavescens]
MENKIYNFDELEGLSDIDLEEILERSWNIENGNFEVWGEVKLFADKTWGYLINPRTISENKLISYPLTGINNTCKFFINPKDVKKIGDENTSSFVRCKLQLSPLSEREKHNIPFEMNTCPGSFSLLEKLPFDISNDIFTNDNMSSFMSKSIYDFYHEKADEKIKDDFYILKKRLNDELLESRKVVEEELNGIKNEKSVAEIERNTTLKANKVLIAKKEILDSKIESLTFKEQEKVKHITQLKKEFHDLEAGMNNKIERLRKYVSDKALFLKTFEFVDEEDLGCFLLESNSNNEIVDGFSFKNILGGDYYKAVSYIQAYLVKKGVLYPRHIVENYITLLRTKDLIVLAGDSGSGKTNLVKSFAKAVGGKSIIIPVKPNWTSSEDLLGYYNPLEKKYLATPFLEALIEANKNPDIPYFICLDEMNLARVEYYFADFLSLLESRDEEPEIKLYAEDESAHVLSELKAVVEIIQAGKEKYSQDGVVNFIELLKDEELTQHLRQAFGFSDKNSLIKYHSEIRRMLSAAITMPSSIKMPENVHIIGAINIDETTHYLSPKILDRAHIMRFESPLLSDWDQILSEVERYDFVDVTKPLLFEIKELGERNDYPKFDWNNEFCKLFIELNKEFFHKLGIEFGMRTIRQGLNYLAFFESVNDDSILSINNFLLHKVLPKFTFDGNKSLGQQTKLDLIEKVFIERIKKELPTYTEMPQIFSAVAVLESVIQDAKVNDGVVNFWS